MKTTVLILISNMAMSDLISFSLNRAGYHTFRADDGRTGLRLIRSRKPDIVLLDLPEGLDPDSFDVCEQIEERGLDTHTLVLVTEDEADLAANLKLEYIVKPFPLRDLLERVKLILMRTESLQGPVIQKFGRITIDNRQAIISKDNTPIDLNQRDYELFCYLVSQPGKVFVREDLMTNVWGYTNYFGDVRLVDVAIRRLRMKIEDNPSKPQFILTRRNVGYYFNADNAI